MNGRKGKTIVIEYVLLNCMKEVGGAREERGGPMDRKGEVRRGRGGGGVRERGRKGIFSHHQEDQAQVGERYTPVAHMYMYMMLRLVCTTYMPLN